MTNFSDPSYLRTHQYKDSTNLDARILLHHRFGTNPNSWFGWVFDHLEIKTGDRLLEVGCGPGSLWQKNQSRLPEDVRLVLGDLSGGMVRKARAQLQSLASFLELSAPELPFPSAYFDRVVANHMLYHVPNPERAVSEFRRVLKPGGRLMAATNGITHMVELTQLIQEFDPSYQHPMGQMRSYSLENAVEVLGKSFAQVQVLLFEDDLVVKEAEPLVAYILSMWSISNDISGERLRALESLVRSKIEAQGSFYIHKSQGVVVAE